MTLFLPRMKKFEETHAKMSNDDLRNHSRTDLEFESELKYPKPSTTTSFPIHVIKERTNLTRPKTTDDFVLKRYPRLVTYYLSRSLKRNSMVNHYFQKKIYCNCNAAYQQ